MHPLNPYAAKRPDFRDLIAKYPILFRRCLTVSSKGEPTIDWRQAHAVRAVTQAMLLDDFNIKVELRDDRLCPPLPNRLNYLCWLCEVIAGGINPDYRDPNIHVLDIGVGASCIYPLLGYKLFGWNFTGSDIDDISLSWSRNLIAENCVSDAIRLVQVESSDAVQAVLEEWCGASMCQGKRFNKTTHTTASSRMASLADNAAVTLSKQPTCRSETTENQKLFRQLVDVADDVQQGDGNFASTAMNESVFVDNDEADAPSEDEEDEEPDEEALHTDASSASKLCSILDVVRCSSCSSMRRSDSLWDRQSCTCQALRGPIRRALVAMGGNYADAVTEAEERNCAHDGRDTVCAVNTVHRAPPAAITPTVSSLQKETTVGRSCAHVCEQQVLSACMTNPPFFTPAEQMSPSRISSPHAICTGIDSEMSTTGGEVAFALSMLVDSLVLRQRVGWYSTMLGKKQSLRVLLRALRTHGVTRSYSTRFLQGKKGASTVRWGLAWTFIPFTPGRATEEKALLRKYRLFGDKKETRRRCTVLSSDSVSLTLSDIQNTCTVAEREYLLCHQKNAAGDDGGRHESLPHSHGVGWDKNHISDWLTIAGLADYSSSEVTLPRPPTVVCSHASRTGEHDCQRGECCWCGPCILLALLLRVVNSSWSHLSEHCPLNTQNARNPSTVQATVEKWTYKHGISAGGKTGDELDISVRLWVSADFATPDEARKSLDCRISFCNSQTSSPQMEDGGVAATATCPVHSGQEAVASKDDMHPPRKRLKKAHHIPSVLEASFQGMDMIISAEDWIGADIDDSLARKSFKVFSESVISDVVRSNRRWRRFLHKKESC